MKTFVLVFTLGLSAAALAQCPGQDLSHIVANPNRPTISDPADITQYGVAEVEYGINRTWDRGATHSTVAEGLYKLAVLCDLEIRWTQDAFVRQAIPGQAAVHGMGDNWVGAQWRVYHQSPRVPTISLRYEVKVPGASERLGLGSGQVDHAFTFMASKDIKTTHFDFNAGYHLSGREDKTGNDQNSEIALAFSHSIHGPWAITGELYGDTKQNAATPGFVSNLWGITYTVRPRLVLDAGLDAGVTSGAPHKTIFAGVTYSLGSFRPLLRAAAHKPHDTNTTAFTAN
jgi:hypothetical protein